MKVRVVDGDGNVGDGVAEHEDVDARDGNVLEMEVRWQRIRGFF